MLPSQEVRAFTALVTKRAAGALPWTAYAQLQSRLVVSRMLFALLVLLSLAAPIASQAQSVTLQGLITTVAGNGTQGSGGNNGPATSAEMYGPTSVAVDGSGNLYIADAQNLVVRKVSAVTGLITIVAGSGSSGYSGDGGPATSAAMGSPEAVAVDGSGNIYIADAFNFRIRVVNTQSTAITIAGISIPAGDIQTVAGNGTAGYSGDGSAATSAEIGNSFGVAVDGSGNIYFSDDVETSNLTAARVREVNASTGKITTVAGNGNIGYSGDNGPATSAKLNFPTGVAVDGSGNLYVVDVYANVVREVNTQSTAITFAGVSIPAGDIQTVAGDGSTGYSGDDGLATGAKLNNPNGVAVDVSGNLYIADTDNNVVRKVNAATGFITTVAGNGTASYSGDNGPAPAAELNSPFGVAAEGSGAFYIADLANNRIREVQTSALNFGSVDVGQSSTTYSIGFSFTASTQLGSIAVLTLGTSGLDFAAASGGTCNTTTTYTAGQSCTVNVIFKPLHPGARMGAVELTSGSNVLAMGYLSGTGIGPEITFNPGVQSTLPSYSGQNAAVPQGVAVDAGLNVYVVDLLYGSVNKYPWTGNAYGAPVQLPFTGLYNPEGVAVDGAGDVFAADDGNSRVVELPWNGSSYGTQIVLASYGFGHAPYPSAVAVDSHGNLFFVVVGFGTVPSALIEMPWTGSGYGSPTTITAAAGLNDPLGVAVDANLNIYIADYGNSRVIEIPWNGTSFGAEITVASGIGAGGVAVDGAGDVYIANASSSSQVVEVPWNGTAFGTPVTPPFPLVSGAQLYGIAVDGYGNLYVSSDAYERVVELNVSTPPSFNFDSTNVGSVSDDSPNTVTISNIGNASLIFTSGTNPNYPTDFPVDTSDSSLCTSATPLTEGGSCDVNMDFLPTTTGPLDEDVVITDNNLNVAGEMQSIPVSGIGLAVSGPPTASLSLSTLNFGGVQIDTTSPALAETVTNTGGGSLNISSVSIAQTGTNVFFLSTGANQCTNTTQLTNGQSCNVYVTFKPAVSGATSSGTLNIADSASGSPQTAALTGVGDYFYEPVGNNSAKEPVSVFFTASGTLSAINVVTMGVQTQDYTLQTGGTCMIGTAYTAGQECTVDVIFSPQYSGTRNGSIYLTNSSGVVLGATFLQGTSNGAQAIFGPVTPQTEVGYITGLAGVAVDGADDLFYLNGSDKLIEEPLSGPAVTVANLNSLLGGVAPNSVAIDSSGNLFIASNSSPPLIEVPRTGLSTWGTPVALNSGVGNVGQVTADALGNLYIVAPNSAVYQLPFTGGGYGTPVTVPFPSSSTFKPEGVAVDQYFDVWAIGENTSTSQTEVMYVPTNNTGFGTAKTITIPQMTSGSSIALDANGNLYFSGSLNSGSSAVYFVPVTGSPILLGTGNYYNLTLDGAGNIFGVQANFSDQEQVVELPVATPPSLTFATTPVGQTSTDSPKALSVIDIGNEALGFYSNSSYPTDFPENNGDTNLCNAEYQVSPGKECDVSVNFTPTVSGLLNEDVTLQENLYNSQATALIPVSGTGGASSPDFTLTTLTPTMEVPLGGDSATYVLTITAEDGFGGTVALGVAGDSNFGVTMPASVTISPGGTQSFNVVLTSNLSPSGSFPFTITGSTSGGLMHSVVITLIVDKPALTPTVTVTPTSTLITTTQADSVTVTVSGGSGNPTATGSVTLTSGTYTSGAVSLSGGSATINIPAGSLATSLDTLTATYTPDQPGALNYANATGSNTVTVTAGVPVFVSNVGTAEAAQAVTVVFTTSGAPSSIQVLTQGVTGLDFTLGSGGTCATGVGYTAGQTCTVNVIFNPRYPGRRLGAVVISGDSTVLATAPVVGLGQGPMINFGIVTSPGHYTPTSSTQFSFQAGANVAVDPNHNLYVTAGNEILEATASSNYQTTSVVVTANSPQGIALDGAGDLIWTDYGTGRILEAQAVNGVIPSNPTPIALGSGWSVPWSSIIDGQGDVFVSDSGLGGIYEIVAVNGVVSASSTVRLVEKTDPGLWTAFDSNGDLFFTSAYQNACIEEIPAVGGQILSSTPIQQVYCSFSLPLSIAVDAAGNLWEADFYTGVSKVVAVNGVIPASPTVIDFNSYTFGLGLDENGNVFWTTYIGGNNNTLSEYDFADPPTFTWSGTTNSGQTAPNTYTAFATDAGNVPITLPVPSSGTNPSINPNWTWATTASGACPSISAGAGSAGTIGLNAICDLTVSFSPITGGSLTGQLTFTDNSLYVANNTQNITLIGTALGLSAPTITWTPATPITYGTALGSGDFSAQANVSGPTNISADGTFSYYITSVGGTAATASTILPVGSDQLCVQWTPSSGYSSTYSTTSTCATVVVNVASTSTSWTPSSTTIIESTGPTSAQFDATATAGSNNVTADGTVTYYLSTVGGTVINVGSTLPLGSDTICAQWTPSSSYSADYNSSSTCQSFTVMNTPTPAINWAPTTPIAYGTALGSGDFAATATYSSNNVSADGTFAYTIGTVGGSAATASTVLPGGANTLCVQWTPLSSYTSQYTSASECLPIQVNAASSSITWSPSSTTIIASTGPTATQLNAAAFAGTTNVTADGTLSYHLSTTTGATITTGSTLTVGPATICAVWTPSSGYSADYAGFSTCQSFTVINTQPTTISVATNGSPVFSTYSVTFTATVTPTSGTIVPTGTVTFLDNGTSIGTGTLSATGTGASASAKLTTSTLAIGTQPITASYPGDTSNQSSDTAVTLPQVIEDFSVTAGSPTTSTIEPGTSATYSITISPVSPATTFPAAITLAAANLPTGATVSFSPASIASGAGSTNVTMTVTTPVTTLARNAPPGRAPAPKWPLMALALTLLPLAGKFRRAGRRLSRTLSLLLLFAAGLTAAAALNGCGGVASGYFGQAPATTTITVTGTSGSLNHSASVSLTVE